MTTQQHINSSLYTNKLPQINLIDHHKIKLQNIRFFTYKIKIKYKTISTF